MAKDTEYLALNVGTPVDGPQKPCSPGGEPLRPGSPKYIYYCSCTGIPDPVAGEPGASSDGGTNVRGANQNAVTPEQAATIAAANVPEHGITGLLLSALCCPPQAGEAETCYRTGCAPTG